MNSLTSPNAETPRQEGLFGFLPLEIKVEIFNNLALCQKNIIRSVCKSWDSLVSGFYGVTLVLRGSIGPVKTSDFQGPINLILHCYDNPLLEGSGGQGQDTVKKLRSLRYMRCLLEHNFVPVLLKSYQLRILEFQQCRVTSPITDMNVYLPPGTSWTDYLPSLRTLNIDLADLAIFPPTEPDFISSLNALVPLFSGKLRDLTLICSERAEPMWSIESFDPRISIERPTISPARKLFEGLVKGNFETLLVIKIWNRANGQKATLHLDPLMLRTPEKFLEKFSESLPTQLLEFAGTQTQLKSFSVYEELNLVHKNQILRVLKSNANTLQTLCIEHLLSQRIHRPEPPNNAAAVTVEKIHWNFDAEHLSYLKSLENLTLRRRSNFRSREPYIGIWAELKNFHRLPKTLRVLCLSLTLAFPTEAHFNSTVFACLENLEVFEFSALPWFAFGGIGTFYMHEQKVRNIVNWLPSLRRLVLGNRTVPRFRAPMSPFTLPAQAINWILFTPGIRYYLSTNDDSNSSYPNQTVPIEVFTIEIQPWFHRNVTSGGSGDNIVIVSQ